MGAEANDPQFAVVGSWSRVSVEGEIVFQQSRYDAGAKPSRTANPISPVPPRRLDSLTVVLGAGMRLFIIKNFAIRSEATSYLTGGSIRSYKDNVAVNIGGSIYF
jgi:hypothetical protein